MELQVSENLYDLEANLAILKLYQFFPQLYKAEIACWILLKAIANLPHTDFVLCKCLLGPGQVNYKFRFMIRIRVDEMVHGNGNV